MSCYINPRTYMQIHTPTVVQGGGGVDEIPLTVFDIWQYFETILPSVESLSSFLQNEVYFIGGGAAGTCDQQWSPSWPLSWILPRIRNQGKTARDGDFLWWRWKITHE